MPIFSELGPLDNLLVFCWRASIALFFSQINAFPAKKSVSDHGASENRFFKNIECGPSLSHFIQGNFRCLVLNSQISLISTSLTLKIYRTFAFGSFRIFATVELRNFSVACIQWLFSAMWSKFRSWPKLGPFWKFLKNHRLASNFERISLLLNTPTNEGLLLVLRKLEAWGKLWWREKLKNVELVVQVWYITHTVFL